MVLTNQFWHFLTFKHLAFSQGHFLMLFITTLVYLSPSNSAHFSKQVSQIPSGYSVKAAFFAGRFFTAAPLPNDPRAKAHQEVKQRLILLAYATFIQSRSHIRFPVSIWRLHLFFSKHSSASPDFLQSIFGGMLQDTHTYYQSNHMPASAHLKSIKLSPCDPPFSVNLLHLCPTAIPKTLCCRFIRHQIVLNQEMNIVIFFFFFSKYTSWVFVG